MNQTPTCADKVPPVNPPTTRPSVPVPKVTPETRLSAVDHLRRRICVPPTPVDLELSVRLGLTDLELTDQFVPVQLDTEAIL